MAAMNAPVSSWDRGYAGEEMFALALHRAGLISRGFIPLRNVLWGNGPGDIDFVIIGPTGVFVWDVKNWGEVTARWTDEMEAAAEVTHLEAQFVFQQLEAHLPVDERGDPYAYLGWVMVGELPDTDYVARIPVVTPVEAISLMTNREEVMSTDKAWELAGYAKSVFTLAGKPEQR